MQLNAECLNILLKYIRLYSMFSGNSIEMVPKVNDCPQTVDSELEQSGGLAAWRRRCSYYCCSCNASTYPCPQSLSRPAKLEQWNIKA